MMNQVDELIKSEEFQKKTAHNVYYIDGIYVTYINGILGEDCMNLSPVDILLPLTDLEKEALQTLLKKYGIPSWDYFDGLKEYSLDEAAYDLFDENDEEAKAIIDKLIEDIENKEFPYQSIAEFHVQLSRRKCNYGEYNYFYEGEMFSIYDSLIRDPRGSYLSYTDEKWIEVLSEIDLYKIWLSPQNTDV